MQLDAGMRVHANDHVNMGQSSNDVIPTALHVSAADLLVHELLPALTHLHGMLAGKAQEAADVVKIGRTHLMDATPVTLGQEISGWARQVELGMDRLSACLPRLGELAQGCHALRSGLTRPPEFGGGLACARAAAAYHPDVLVFACNTASVHALGALRAGLAVGGPAQDCPGAKREAPNQKDNRVAAQRAAPHQEE